jgi:hypothetical protein
MTSAILAWAIKAPDGNFVVNTRNNTEEKAWGTVWKELKDNAIAHGYRCVRVSIQDLESTAVGEQASKGSSSEQQEGVSEV